MGSRQTGQIDIAPMSAGAFTVEKGATVRITDIQGSQPGDMVAFNRDDLSERFSQARTRVENRKWRLTAGDALWTNAQPPRVMFSITRDTAGAHSLLYSPCCRYALQLRFDVSRDGCLENMAGALKPWEISPLDLPDPFNLFFNARANADGGMSIGEHTSRAGDLIELTAEMDCLVAVSTCSVPQPGRENSGFRVEILG